MDNVNSLDSEQNRDVAKCLMGAGTVDSLWDCPCSECSKLQHELNTTDDLDCGCPRCAPEDWA